ncbi:LysR family transcriptional regulator [Nonomuraea diastatica]|uniref:LysR family transcriptional regulator n=1 Tax=Nonomuraea diastatica TaxID=1848329 RepID=A0A4R4WGV0_9ACTN|nr:LysR family transcriptional regulator [Nonomuraea diastatica]
MQPHQLEYFVAVAETGSFTAGAQRVRVVQSAVSTAVRQLERELGSALFVRGRRISLTPEGEALLPRARDVLHAMEAAVAAVAATRGQVIGTVNLGLMHHLAAYDLVGRLASFRRKHPAAVVHARSSTAGSRGHLDALRRGDLDLALVATAAETVPGVHLQCLDREPLRLVCSATHPLAGSATVRLEQIVDEAFIDFPAGWGNRSLVDSTFAAAGLRRTVHTEIIDFTMAQSLVREQLGVTFIPASAVWTDPLLVAIDVDPAIIWTARLAHSTSRPLSAAAAALAVELKAGTLSSEDS